MVSRRGGSRIGGGSSPGDASERRPHSSRYGAPTKIERTQEADPGSRSSFTRKPPQAVQAHCTSITDLSNRLPVALPLYLLLLALGLTAGQAQPSTKQQQTSVPYKTYYVTSACEWKSNLFVPKSNDILFAQPQATSGADQQLQLRPHLDLQQVSAFGGAEQEPQQLASASDTSRTILNTDSEALILALPIMMAHSFAGYEQACSIRLIVPRNMRILAKLMSRRFSLAQQSEPAAQFVDQGQSVWVNVSHNQFAETEHRVLATEGNVIAFRFLLERFANRLAPDARFQVLLTAFKPLSENSSPEQQLICDRERIISTSLACDGFENCQDGSDEELATCLALRATLPPDRNQQPGSSLLNPTQSRPEIAVPMKQTEKQGLWNSVWTILAGGDRTIVGHLLSLLLLILLLSCCVCHLYLCVLFRRRYRNRQRRPRLGRHSPVVSTTGDLRAAAVMRQASQQNEQNLARQKRILSGESEIAKVPPVLHSILKKKTPPGAMLEPQFRPQLALQQTQQHQRGALQNSLIRQGLSAGRHTISPHLFQAAPPKSYPALEPAPTPAKRGQVRPNTTRSPPEPSARPQYLVQPQSPGPPTTTSSSPLTRPPATPRHRSQPASNNTTGTQRVTTYHYSGGSTRLSDDYLERLVADSNQARRPASHSQSRTGVVGQQQAPANLSSQQSSLI